MFRCATKNEFVKLRNALITSFMIRFVRRALEFCELTIAEYKAIKALKKKEGDEQQFVLKVKKHKTSMHGSAEVILGLKEKAALDSYMLYAREFGSECKKNSCPVFITSSNPTTEQYCSKLMLSTLTKIVMLTALKAGVSSRNVNTKLLRRSTISMAWEETSDPRFRLELSQLAGHTLDTARRYYAFIGTGEQLKRVVNKLEEYRR